jgi:hypothetical protein
MPEKEIEVSGIPRSGIDAPFKGIIAGRMGKTIPRKTGQSPRMFACERTEADCLVTPMRKPSNTIAGDHEQQGQ